MGKKWVKNLKAKKIVILYDDFSGEQKRHIIEVQINDEKLYNEKREGLYIPVRYGKNKHPVVILKDKGTNTTIRHEAFQATKDFFQKKIFIEDEDFNFLFDANSSYGEEAFAYYYEYIYQNIKQAIKELNKGVTYE